MIKLFSGNLYRKVYLDNQSYEFVALDMKPFCGFQL